MGLGNGIDFVWKLRFSVLSEISENISTSFQDIHSYNNSMNMNFYDLTLWIWRVNSADYIHIFLQNFSSYIQILYENPTSDCRLYRTLNSLMSVKILFGFSFSEWRHWKLWFRVKHGGNLRLRVKVDLFLTWSKIVENLSLSNSNWLWGRLTI